MKKYLISVRDRNVYVSADRIVIEGLIAKFYSKEYLTAVFLEYSYFLELHEEA